MRKMTAYRQGTVQYILDVKPNNFPGKSSEMLWMEQFTGWTPLRDALAASQKQNQLMTGALSREALDNDNRLDLLIWRCAEARRDHGIATILRRDFDHKYNTLAVKGRYVPGMIQNIELLIRPVGNGLERLKEELFPKDEQIDSEMEDLLKAYMENYREIHLKVVRKEL